MSHPFITVMLLFFSAPAVWAFDPVAAVPPAEDGFTPPDLMSIPDGPFGDAVRAGKHIFDHTPESSAAKFVGNQQSCRHCHLASGTLAGSAPMWAAWVAYPAWRSKNQIVNTMEERLQGCFTYSMNAQDSEYGKAPPAGHAVLKELQSYMFWLAQDAPTGNKKMPGRGYAEIPEPAKPHDPERGKEVYANNCAVCHQSDGSGKLAEGTVVFPPLWGDGAYNWGAGMHRVNTVAAFIHANMPLGQGGTLSHQQAWDVAAYINSQPRPDDPRNQHGLAKTAQKYHQHDCYYGSERAVLP